MAENTQPDTPTQVQAQGALTPPTDDEKFFGALSYFGFLFLLTFVAKPKSEYCQFHARQSLVLFCGFLGAMLLLFIFHLLGSLVMLVIFAVYILAIYRAYSGDRWEIPVVSKFVGKINPENLYKTAGLALSSIEGMKEKLEDTASKAADSVKNSTEQK